MAPCDPKVVVNATIKDGGVAKMRYLNPDALRDPYEWVPAETPAQTMGASGENANTGSTKDLVDTLKETRTTLGDSDVDLFSRGKDEFVKWYRSGRTALVGAAGYVLTPGHKMYMSSLHDGSEVGKEGFYHSSYTSGKGVVCSGSVSFEKGIPLLITNLSGHYTPEPRKLDYVIRLFEITGVPIDKLAVLILVDKKKRFYDIGELNQFRQELRTI